MEGYLLDNNVISILMRPKDSRHAQIMARLKALGASPVYLPVIAIAEIEYGIAKADKPDEGQCAKVRRFFADYPVHLPIDDDTIEPYALIRAQLWREHGTKEKRGHKEKLPEEIVHRESGKLLGIDERDLLIASVAIQYNLVLVTCDRGLGMRIIDEEAAKLGEMGFPVRLRISYWGQ